MPPAIHEQRLADARPRSIDLDREPALAELERGRQAGDAGSDNSDLDGSRDMLPFLRRHDPDQVQRVQPIGCLRPASEAGHPSDVRRRRLPACRACQAAARCADSPKPRNRAGRTSIW
jgi:hypothetical protein